MPATPISQKDTYSTRYAALALTDFERRPKPTDVGQAGAAERRPCHHIALRELWDRVCVSLSSEDKDSFACYLDPANSQRITADFGVIHADFVENHIDGCRSGCSQE